MEPGQATNTKVSNPYSSMEVDTPKSAVYAWLNACPDPEDAFAGSRPIVFTRTPTPPVSPSSHARQEVQRVIESLKLRAAALGAGLINRRRK